MDKVEEALKGIREVVHMMSPSEREGFLDYVNREVEAYVRNKDRKSDRENPDEGVNTDNDD